MEENPDVLEQYGFNAMMRKASYISQPQEDAGDDEFYSHYLKN